MIKQEIIGIVLAEKMTLMRKYLKSKFREANAEIEFEEWMYLLPIRENGSMDQTAYGNQIGRDKTIVAKLVKDFESRNLIIRTADKSDVRKKLISLSPEGKTLHKKLEKLVKAADAEFISQMINSEVLQLNKLINTIHVPQ